MSDHHEHGPGSGEDGLSEDEVRAYLGQMRVAPLDQILAEVLSAILNAAQVKLGRRDGRVLLDLAADVVGRVRGHADAKLVGDVDAALAQLRMGQVEAEQELARRRSSGEVEDEPNDLPVGAPASATDTSAQESTASPPPPAAGGGTSKLWVPGR